MEDKWRFFQTPEVMSRLLTADLDEIVMDLLMISDRGPGEFVMPASMVLLNIGQRDRSKAMLRNFVEIFSSTDMLKEGAEYMLAVMVHKDMVDPATLVPFVDLCRELGAEVIMPDPDSSVVIFG